jgi:hypothetical protein
VPDCANCQDVGWVCEEHPDRPWSQKIANGCQCGARLPCPDCNPAANAATPPKRVVEKIEALSQKTVARGCTPGEARAALAKVIELKGRYGISAADIEYGDLFAVLDDLDPSPHWPAPRGVPKSAWDAWCRRRRRQRAKQLRKEKTQEPPQRTERALSQYMLREGGQDFQVTLTVKSGWWTITMRSQVIVATSEGESFSEAWNNIKCVIGHVRFSNENV